MIDDLRLGIEILVDTSPYEYGDEVTEGMFVMPYHIASVKLTKTSGLEMSGPVLMPAKRKASKRSANTKYHKKHHELSIIKNTIECLMADLYPKGARPAIDLLRDIEVDCMESIIALYEEYKAEACTYLQKHKRRYVRSAIAEQVAKIRVQAIDNKQQMIDNTPAQNGLGTIPATTIDDAIGQLQVTLPGWKLGGIRQAGLVRRDSIVTGRSWWVAARSPTGDMYRLLISVGSNAKKAEKQAETGKVDFARTRGGAATPQTFYGRFIYCELPVPIEFIKRPNGKRSKIRA